jgi:pimeloyl-ACP methyl ester carboxylesterase
MTSNENPTFALVHGSWHDSWCMEQLSAALATRGYLSIAIDIPIGDTDKNYDDYGMTIAQALEDQTNVVGVFHSNAGNHGPRGVNILNDASRGERIVDKMIFLNSGFDGSTLNGLGISAQEVAAAPPKNSLESKTTIFRHQESGGAITTFDNAKATELLYHDVENELAIEAIRHLRPQYRSPNQPKLTAWPNISQSYIICEDDKIVRPEWSEFACRNWLGVTPHYLPGGHSPFLSRPAHLANLLIEIALEQ